MVRRLLVSVPTPVVFGLFLLLSPPPSNFGFSLFGSSDDAPPKTMMRKKTQKLSDAVMTLRFDLLLLYGLRRQRYNGCWGMLLFTCIWPVSMVSARLLIGQLCRLCCAVIGWPFQSAFFRRFFHAQPVILSEFQCLQNVEILYWQLLVSS